MGGIKVFDTFPISCVVSHGYLALARCLQALQAPLVACQKRATMRNHSGRTRTWNITHAVQPPTPADTNIPRGQNKPVAIGKFLQALQTRQAFHECTSDSGQPYLVGQHFTKYLSTYVFWRGVAVFDLGTDFIQPGGRVSPRADGFRCPTVAQSSVEKTTAGDSKGASR